MKSSRRQLLQALSLTLAAQAIPQQSLGQTKKRLGLIFPVIYRGVP